MPDRIDYARSRAVLIGTAVYRDSRFPPLPAAANSLTAMRQVLADPDLCRWPDQRITVMEDAADMPRVVKTLRRLARETEELLLIYFVGHGVILPRGRLCLILADTDADDPDITGLAYEWIRESFRDSPARLKIAILDCCYSGRAIEALSAEIADQTDARGVYTLTASDHAAHVLPFSEQATNTTSFTGELLDLVRTGIPRGPDYLTLGMLYLHLRQRLYLRGLPQPNQRGTDTADQFPFTRNAAIRDRGAGHALPKPASDAASTVLRPAVAERLSARPDLVLCGDSALVLRTAQELTARYGEDVTVIVPAVKGGIGAQLTHLPRVQVIESSDLSADALHDAGVTSARVLGLLDQDDLGNFYAALRAQELNVNLRFVVNLFNLGLGERIRPFLTDSVLLDASSIAAPSLVAAALGEQAPSHVWVAGRTLYAGRRKDVRSGLVVCGLADTRRPGGPQVLPDDQESADVVLAASDGSPPNRLLRKRWGRIPGLDAPVKTIRGRQDGSRSTGQPGLVFPRRRDFGLDRMTDHVIVAGLGKVGTRVLGQLHDLGHRVAGIDLTEDADGVAMAQRLKIPVVIGLAEREETLRAARVGHCRALVCATGKDWVNLETALNARAITGDVLIVLRLLDDDLAERVERTIGGFLCVRNVADLAAPAFAAAMLDHRVLRTIAVARHILLIAEVPVEAESELAGSLVWEVEHAGQARVIAISRRASPDDVDWMRRPGYRLAAGDRLFVVGTRAGLGQILARNRPPSAR